VSEARLLNGDLEVVEGCQCPTGDLIEAHGVEVVLCEEAEHKPIPNIRYQRRSID
jgi:hypothetical protein